jgi:hypothetical protein
MGNSRRGIRCMHQGSPSVSAQARAVLEFERVRSEVEELVHVWLREVALLAGVFEAMSSTAHSYI